MVGGYAGAVTRSAWLSSDWSVHVPWVSHSLGLAPRMSLLPYPIDQSQSQGPGGFKGAGTQVLTLDLRNSKCVHEQGGEEPLAPVFETSSHKYVNMCVGGGAVSSIFTS